jgi:hypothetical protein
MEVLRLLCRQINWPLTLITIAAQKAKKCFKDIEVFGTGIHYDSNIGAVHLLRYCLSKPFRATIYLEMLAHHPITGKPIKIMKTETQLYKNQRTALWVRGGPSTYDAPHRLGRWLTIVTNSQDAIAWSDVLTPTVVLVEPTVHAVSWITGVAPRKGQLLFLSRAVMTACGGPEFFKDQKFQNVVCLEELIEIFPHTLRSFNDTDKEAAAVLLVGMILRAARVFGFKPNELEEIKPLSKQAADTYGLQVGGPAEPEQLWLIQQYFVPTNKRRAKEIDQTLLENINQPLVDTILLLNEEPMVNCLPKSNKIKELIVGHRLSYADVLRTIKDYVPQGTIVAFANSDISLTDTLRDLWFINMTDLFLAILRYEPSNDDSEPTLFGPRPDSQDTWAILSDEVKKRDWGTFSEFDFPFGKAGCDNAMAMEMLRKKFRVANPALSLMTIHNHKSAVRTYSNDDVVEKSVFLYLEPTGIHDLEPKTDLRLSLKPWAKPQPFNRRINAADERHAKTFCRMVSREGVYLYEPESNNTFTPDDERIYQFSNAFTTTNGLVYGYNSMYLGTSPTVRERWSTTLCSHMTPAIGVKSVLAAPLTDDVAKDTHLYIANYVSQIFRMNAQGYMGDMWLPREAHRLQEFLQWFRWNQEVLPVLPRDTDVVAYAENTTMLPPSANPLPLREEIEALRARCTMWTPRVKNHRRVVIVQDDIFFTDNDIFVLEGALEDNGYEVTVVYPSRSSASYLYQRMFYSGICIVPSGVSKLFWTLSRRARVIHVMPELETEGLSAHTAGAADLDYWLVLLAGRMNKEARQKAIVERVLATITAKSLPLSRTTEETPNLILPIEQEGIHQHSGDSFREMAEIWADRGYVNIQRSSQTPYCWLGGIGKTLLYDRATPMWIKQDPAPYERILCGNPHPMEIQGGRVWSFWPRRPRIVEEKAPKLAKKGWSERPDTLVFYGRVENQVQLKKRNNMLHKACDEFSCPVDAMAAYKYSQEEYIEKLSDAKFGLCLAGYGPKCNREIECLAVGTVPVVAPDVDMANYAVPPREGLEYIRLNSFDPEEAKVRIAAVTEEEWSAMSKAAHAWWRANASAEGLWDLTKTCIQ